MLTHAPSTSGLTGAAGEPGGRGRFGKAGKAGSTGPRGLPGVAGEVGPHGLHGVCNCSLPEMFVQRVTVPGPSVIVTREVEVVVPVIVVKEITVPYPVPMTQPTRSPLSLPPLLSPPPTDGPRTTTAGRPPIESPPTVQPSSTASVQLGQNVTTLPPANHTMSAPTDANFTDDSVTATASTNLTEPYNETSEMPTTTYPYTGVPTLGYNRRECMLDAVGIPVLHAESQYGTVGSWMRDSEPTTDAEKRWVTDDYASPVLYEYRDELSLRNKKQLIKLFGTAASERRAAPRRYYVDYLASGTGSVVYRGSFFYQRHDAPSLVRYDLNSTRQTETTMDGMAHRDCAGRRADHLVERCNATERHRYLYDQPHNFADFAVDENGLWVVYALDSAPGLVVSKLEFEDLYVVRTWTLADVNATTPANSFIMCGVLYALESGGTRDTRINYAYDLYNDERLNVSIAWFNPYLNTTMLDYSPIDRRLYFYDAGKLLSVNVRANDTTPAPPTTAPVNVSTTAMPPTLPPS